METQPKLDWRLYHGEPTSLGMCKDRIKPFLKRPLSHGVLCGITERTVDLYFKDHIDELSQKYPGEYVAISIDDSRQPYVVATGVDGLALLWDTNKKGIRATIYEI